MISTNNSRICFNTQPPEGGCKDIDGKVMELPVSTHSRPKAAGAVYRNGRISNCFNTQPPEGG